MMDITNTHGDVTDRRLDTSHNNISKIHNNENNETVIAFMEDKVARNDYLDFDGHINTIVSNSQLTFLLYRLRS